ncbi:MAG TPA: glycosyltransferase [Burkholderiales bacterium]|nr:glycosyltransferase [Burkholderiales bacterium]
MIVENEKILASPLQLRASIDASLNATAGTSSHLVSAGKFIARGTEKVWIKGVTYGTFRGTGDNAGGYPQPQTVEADFAAMARAGINTVRTYTVPPRSLLDAALRHGLKVMVGLPWEQHITFLDDVARVQRIVESIRAAVRACERHPAVFCYAVGNEIPAPIVRWHGRRRIENFIRVLYDAAKREHPEALVTYVNYPTTEYLQLPFLDVVCFNVYLESEERLGAYLARLQNLAGERPLLLAEIGLDSRRNGEAAQAAALDWQIRTAFGAGCAGTFVFGWTDEWYRGGHDIEDWDFGITTRDRRPKAALAAVERAYAEVPFGPDIHWPRVSIVVCSCNGERTIRDTLNACSRLDYPDYEVIVVDDGSRDSTAAIARGYPVRLISTENRGLSSARNTGWQEATGDIVAYIDDDAYPDPHWLKYLAYTFVTTAHAAVGGPNIAPPGDGLIADCVANAPGGPVHVLLTDTEAEHIPGCNMAFRREALEAIGGFDVRFRAAGDDVDVCWRLMEGGYTIGFHAAAMDWHHRRNSLAMYWRQQKGYGRAEALLEEKWPERYNAVGHLVWEGRMYGKGYTEPLVFRRWHVYQGTWGTAAYQSLYEREPGTIASLPLMPEWYFVVALLTALSALGFVWSTLALVTLPLLALATAAPIAQAVAGGARARFATPARSRSEAMAKRALTALLHLIQPVARLSGRIQHGLLPWRRRGTAIRGCWLRRATLWSEAWRAPEDWTQRLESELKAQGAVVFRAGAFDRWDLHVRGGLFGAARGLLTVEDHGAGRQLIRLGIGAWAPSPVVSVSAGLMGLAVVACIDAAWLAAGVLGTLGGLMWLMALHDSARAAASWAAAIKNVRAGAAATPID